MAQLNGLIVSDDQEFVIAVARRLRSGAVSVRLHGKGPQGAKPKTEVVAEILAAIKERRA